MVECFGEDLEARTEHIQAVPGPLDSGACVLALLITQPVVADVRSLAPDDGVLPLKDCPDEDVSPQLWIVAVREQAQPSRLPAEVSRPLSRSPSARLIAHRVAASLSGEEEYVGSARVTPQIVRIRQVLNTGRD